MNFEYFFSKIGQKNTANNSETWDGKYQIIIKTARNDRCYFWPYAPGQSLRTAEDMQAKQGSEGCRRASYRVVVLSVIVALLGVLPA